jgi:hypothetical protein
MISAGVADALHRTIEWQTRSPKSAEGRTAARYGTGVPFANLTDDRRLFFYAPGNICFWAFCYSLEQPKGKATTEIGKQGGSAD